MTRLALLDSLDARLREAGIDAPRRTAEWIVEEVTGAARAALYARPDATASSDARMRAETMLARRIAGEPIQYVLGHTDFYGLRLRVTPDVLIPRPETEEVVEAALQRLQDRPAPWVLDVGTGSGAIALAIKAQRPDAEVFAVDVSGPALGVARLNAEQLGHPVLFIEADALRPAFADAVPPTFDLVISNPPYVPDAERATMQREVVDHEPEEALFVSDADPLSPYRALAGHALRLLRPGGTLVVETHAHHGPDVAALFATAGLSDAVCLPDLAGRPRIAIASAS